MHCEPGDRPGMGIAMMPIKQLTKNLTNFKWGAIVTIAIIFSAGPSTASAAYCPDSEIFGAGMITHICWACIFPVVVSGAKLGDTGAQIPPGAATDTEVFCLCQDNLGVYHVGVPTGMWQPSRLMELTRLPYCSTVLGGNMLHHNTLQLGSADRNIQPGDLAFYQFHYYAFPLLVVLELFMQPQCNPGMYGDVAIKYLSELDPTWNHDLLAFYMAPETALFANPVAQAACIADAIAATTTRPIEELWWCAGSWGSLYPMTGHVVANASPPRITSLLATRALAAMHRRGLARDTMGMDSFCDNPFALTLPKLQYRFEQIFPVPEADSNHWIGESTFTWGEWRTVPAVGEDYVNLIWTWTDCCAFD